MRLDDYDGAAAIAAGWADGLRPDPALTVSAWADNRRVPSPKRRRTSAIQLDRRSTWRQRKIDSFERGISGSCFQNGANAATIEFGSENHPRMSV